MSLHANSNNMRENRELKWLMFHLDTRALYTASFSALVKNGPLALIRGPLIPKEENALLLALNTLEKICSPSWLMSAAHFSSFALV